MTERSPWHPRMLAYRTLRVASSPWRCLPDFLIAGAQKSGTSSLYAYLRRHPDIHMPACKETVFFAKAFRASARYRYFFPSLAERRRWEANRGCRLRLGEATPYYLVHPAVPVRVARLLPQAQVIVLLRDPVERAYSHYRHNVRLGLETLSFEEAIEAEPRRIAGEETRLERGGFATSDAFRHFTYVTRGHYAGQLRRWFDAVGRDRVLVLLAEDLFQDPGATVNRVERFLEVEPTHEKQYTVENAGASGEPMADATRKRLREVFAPSIEELRELTGVEPRWE